MIPCFYDCSIPDDEEEWRPPSELGRVALCGMGSVDESSETMKKDETHDFAIMELDGVVYGYDIWRTMSGRDDEEVLDETHLLAVPDATGCR